MTYLEALQDALAAEHAALFVVGYLGAQTSASAEPQLFADLTSSYSAHRALRDELIARVRQADAEPTPAAAAYDLDDVGGDPTRIRQRALDLELACATTYGYLVANSPSKDRRLAVEALIATSLREVRFGGSPRPLPGR